ncbi:MAG: hypothetical protein ACOVPA_11110 [Rubrivivax sp.]|jgi:hypothetical protein
MRITQCDDEVVVAFSGGEASRLMDACAMVVLAAESVPDVRLPADLAGLLCDLFDGLRISLDSAGGSDQPQGVASSLQGP